MDDLGRYFERIGYRGSPRADLATLRELHRAHLLAIPYETFDVQLGRPLGLEIGPTYRKLVDDRRGGWCYEMNGLFEWALETIGFSFTRLAGGVRRDLRGDAALGNHLALWVHLDRSYLADVGFGQGPLDPVPIVAGPIPDRGVEHALEDLGGGWWRFHGRMHPHAPSFDFHLSPADPELFARRCAELQTLPESVFKQVTIAQRHVADGVIELRARTLRHLRAGRVTERVIANLDDYAATLRDAFASTPPEIERLWDKAVQQHEIFLARLASAPRA
jgi:N-hydroxyarylamine O-acetyltransferase